ncbi:uncharacterized protein LOC110973096 isoform X2 [Acanthaster planci]|uniref:Uncharacterized protein LOC110973096 isoform X2 n=1 Tax=Acanthaster planci TaxID=133434 RepID=A0A8B7XEU4_ACAPL|nr:uncharacterized protein LOC110973096 isoform X2 [Acanthaster planci]
MRPAVSSRSLPTMSNTRQQQHQLSASDEGSTAGDSIPYRLPKIPCSQQRTHSSPSACSERVTRSEPAGLEQLYKVDYFGSDRLEKYLGKRKTLPSPPYTIAQLQRQEGIHMPTFQKVHIEPVLPCDKVVDSSGDAVPEQTTGRARDTVTLLGLGRQVSGKPRESPSSVDKPFAWRLSPHNHKNYDNQAIQGQTGPFSRDFVVHCNTPNTWLKMKLKKQRTSWR